MEANGGTVEIGGALQIDGACDVGGPLRIAGKDVAKSLAAVRG